MILDLPIIEWKLGWQYSAAFMLHWLVNDNDEDIKFDNANLFLEQYKMFTDCLDDGLLNIGNGELFPNGDVLNRLINLGKSLEVGKKEIISLKNEFQQNPESNNYIANSAVSILKFIGNYDDLKASFGRISLLFYFTGTVEKTDADKLTVLVDGIFYRINDSFDFYQDDSFKKIGYDDQPLGNWKWDVVNPEKPTAGGYLLNSDFRNFATNIGKSVIDANYRIVTNYNQVIYKPINSFEINLANNEIQNIK